MNFKKGMGVYLGLLMLICLAGLAFYSLTGRDSKDRPTKLVQKQTEDLVGDNDARAIGTMPGTLEEIHWPGHQDVKRSGAGDVDTSLEDLEGRLSEVLTPQEVKSSFTTADVKLLKSMLGDTGYVATWTDACMALCTLEPTPETVSFLQGYVARFEDFRVTRNEDILVKKALTPIFLACMEDHELAIAHLRDYATHEGSVDALQGWNVAELEDSGLTLELFLKLVRRGAYYGLARLNTDDAQQVLNMEYAMLRNKFIDKGELSDYELEVSYAVCEALGEFNGIRELGKDEYLRQKYALSGYEAISFPTKFPMPAPFWRSGNR